MPIVFDSHTRRNDNSNSENNGHQLLPLQQQQKQQGLDTTASLADYEEERIMKSGTLQHALKKNTIATAWSLHTPSPEHSYNKSDADTQQQSRLLSSGNDTSPLTLSSIPEPTETETRQSAAKEAPVKASCLPTKLDPVVIVSDQGDPDEVSWAAASQPDPRQHHHRPQQQQQQQQQQQKQHQQQAQQEQQWRSILSFSPSRSDSLTAVIVDLDPASVARRGNVVLDTSSSTEKSGSSVATSSSLSSLFSENSIPYKEEEPSPGQTEPVVHCTPPSQASSSQQQHHQKQQPSALPPSSPPPAQPLDSYPSSLVIASSSSPSSNEREGNEGGRHEQARTKKRKSMDDDFSINNSERFPSPFPSPIETDYSSSLLSSSSTSKGLIVCKSEPTTETTIDTVSLPIEPSEKRARKRRVSEGHNTTPAAKAKATKNVETPASSSNNNRLERRKASSSTPTSSTARPSCSYTTMIMEVFQASNKAKLDLPDIYSGITAKYPFYRKAGKVWQSSVRHALSQSKFFCKLERGPGEPGKGSLWIIDSQNKQTPNPARKRKASGGNLGGGDYVSDSACPAIHSKNAASPKLTCTTTIGKSLEDGRSREFHSSAASIPSPAASDDADDSNTVRRSGRARRPPRTKEADDYITTTINTRKPSLVAGASLSTPPSSPAPHDRHSETTARMISPPPPSSSTRKRSSSIRSDKSHMDSVVSHMNHFTIDLPSYSPSVSAPATPAATTGTYPRKAPLELEFASIPGVVTSPRVRRPPQKLAEFVSSEDFKAAPCGKRPSLVSALSSTSSTSENQDRTAISTATKTTQVAEAGQRVEMRGKKRARPNVGDQSSSSSQQQQNGVNCGVVGHRNRRVTAVKDAVTPARQQRSISSPATAAVLTAQSSVGATAGCAPAFISLKDLELSHAASQEEEEDCYEGRSNNNRSGTRGVFSRRHGGGGGDGRPVCQNETYEQRRLAGIQQIVVASLDWYEESDSEDEDVDIEGGSNTDISNNSGKSTIVGRGGTVRSGCDSGFDSGSDSCKGFVREADWMMTTTTEVTELAEELDIDSAASSQVLERCQSEAFETVCIASPEVLAVGGALVEDLSTSGTAVSSHFLDHTGAGLVADQDRVEPSPIATVGIDVAASSLLPIITGDATSPLTNMIDGGIPEGILKELVAVGAATLAVEKASVSGIGIEGGLVVGSLEVEGDGGDASVHIEVTTAAAAATASEPAELKADLNYMGWLNL
ncbi:Forkhead box protein K1 [Haplosporangium gracile]|nr:Forkhead box protein K1 [Haplosporangium gracile]